ncbi:MAG TPA: efflux RND transporter periplasmic adaptor subunit [Rudaea sp.]|jgi:RND family efflux transporter MFP subunit|nr:efflux RND transporter periplasmic adaptor subunit [Rudaea sp.]
MSQPKKSWRGLRLAGVVVAIVAILIVIHGVWTRASESSHLRDWTDAQALPTVALVSPSTGQNSSGLELPGRLEAYARAPIYARVSGYLKDYKVDIGAQVKTGQLLADIETPDLDQQLSQGRADLNTAQANASLAKTTSDRWQTIVKTGAVAKQDADEKLGDLLAKQAMVKSAQANVERLVALKNFTHITAPFDGVVTARNTDVGALINVGSSAGQELFVVSDTHKLRAYVNVPQSEVPDVPAGTKATITVPEHPGRKYEATVESSAQSVSAASGTTLMQIAVDNPNGELLPGGYASVRLDLPGDANVVSVPASALIFDAQGLSVATVGNDNHVLIKRVTIARDLGKTIEIRDGLNANDKVIESPPDGIATGAEVRIAAAKQDKPQDNAPQKKG